ncbi:hypothetical protein [Nocardia gipuzkoensis]
MSKYTVVIVREEQHGPVDGYPRLTMHVDTGAPKPRVTGVTVSSGGPDGLTSSNFPQIDLPAVIEALAARMPARSASSEPPLPDDSSIPATESVKEAHDPVDTETADSAEPESGRAYRKMPDPDELRENLQKIGTVTGLAKYYGVPRHTAQGWVGRLKKLDTAASQAAPEPE